MRGEAMPTEVISEEEAITGCVVMVRPNSIPWIKLELGTRWFTLGRRV